jgi:hypothetical protein
MYSSILRIEIEGVRESICAALSAHEGEVNAIIKETVNKYFTVEVVQEKIETQVVKAIDNAISSLCDQFQVKEIIKDIVVKSLINKRDEIERKNEL